jgi:uncharacterized cupredoxin-like copper-binding protein
MQYQAIFLLALLLPVGSAMAQQPHAIDGPQGFAFGQPAAAEEASRTIHVDASDKMQLQFDAMDIRAGEVVKFIVHNRGQARHEFSIGDEAFGRQHLSAMRQQMSGMAHQHHAGNVLSLEGGQTGTMVWRFAAGKGKTVLFACYIPGHFQAGMYRRHVLLPPLAAG